VATITAITGITDAKADKLRGAGIRTTDALLEQANTAKRREKLVADTQVNAKQLDTWVNHADLMRVKGVSGATAALLDAAGVKTLKDLRGADAEKTAAAMERRNNARKEPLVKRAPSAKVVQGWVDGAKDLKLVVRA
jgi:predicted RecB family nuclease